MAKRSLTQAAKAPSKKTPLDLAEEHAHTPTAAPTRSPTPGRSTDRMSISLLTEERTALEDRADHFRRAGRRDLKASRLARIAFEMLFDASDEEVLQIADRVPNLEMRRVQRI